MIALDTNLLVYAHRAGTPEHDRAKKALARAIRDPRGFGIAVSCLPEFWSVVTHPAAAGRPSTPREARDFLRALVEDGGGSVWTPTPGFGERLVRLAADRDVGGPRIFDLSIALLAFENNAQELWTHDRSFEGVPGLEIVDPL